jgi:hypothetical protein
MPRDRLALEDEVDAILQQLQGLQERLQAQHGDLERAQAQSKAEAASAAATESTQIARAALAALRKAH